MTQAVICLSYACACVMRKVVGAKLQIYWLLCLALAWVAIPWQVCFDSF